MIGFGGYPCLPVMIAARLGGFPTAIHEQNAVLGRVNRLVADGVRAVAASLPIARYAPKNGKRIAFTGNPVRPQAAALAGNILCGAATKAGRSACWCSAAARARAP